MVVTAVDFDQQAFADDGIHPADAEDRHLRSHAQAEVAEAPAKEGLEAAVGILSGQVNGFSRRSIRVPPEPTQISRVGPPLPQCGLEHDEELLDSAAVQNLSQDPTHGRCHRSDATSAVIPVLDTFASVVLVAVSRGEPDMDLGGIIEHPESEMPRC
ncbi:hypothetical protein GCM10010459_19700 [Microbacterium schleiferi]